MLAWPRPEGVPPQDHRSLDQMCGHRCLILQGGWLGLLLPRYTVMDDYSPLHPGSQASARYARPTPSSRWSMDAVGTTQHGPSCPVTDRTRLLSDNGPRLCLQDAFRDYQCGMVEHQAGRYPSKVPFHPQTNDGSWSATTRPIKRDVNQVPYEYARRP